MNYSLLTELFRAAHDYHAAIARYAAVLRAQGDIETAVQDIMGTSVHYRMALDKLVDSDDYEALSIVAGVGRLDRLRRLLASASRRYNMVKRAARPPAGELGADW